VPDLTILICSADHGRMLEASLPAALAQDGVDAEVRVIDNGSADNTSEVAWAHPEARLIQMPERRPYAEAYNAALAEPSADAVLILNADCFLEPGFCAAALDALEGDRIGAVQGKLIRTKGPRPQDRTREIDSVGIVFDRRHRNTIAGHGAPADAYSMPGPVFGPDGAAALWSRRALDEVAEGGEVFDTSMSAYATDADLAWRARLQGWRSVYTPQAVAYHVRTYSPSTRESVAPELRREQFRNRYLMMAKNDSAALVGRHLPWIASFEVMALGHALLRERSLLRGYLEAARRLPDALRRRRASGRTASPRHLAPFFAGLAPLP
jgi:GT2 family glycosyltransferase